MAEINEGGRIDSGVSLNMERYASVLAVLDLAQTDAFWIKTFQ